MQGKCGCRQGIRHPHFHIQVLACSLKAAWARQVVYGSVRLGLYRSLTNSLRKPGQESLPFLQKVGAGLTAGAVGATMGNPADLALTRQQADGTLPPESRRNYKGVLDAITRIAREEGLGALWKGAAPSVARACAVPTSQLVSYDVAKETAAPWLGGGDKEAWPVRILAACVSAAVASVFSLPVDMIKTRIMRQAPGPDGTMPYRGMLDCGAKIVSREGPLALWTGLPTFFVRLAPHTILSLLIMEALLKAYDSQLEDLRRGMHPLPPSRA